MFYYKIINIRKNLLVKKNVVSDLLSFYNRPPVKCENKKMPGKKGLKILYNQVTDEKTKPKGLLVNRRKTRDEGCFHLIPLSYIPPALHLIPFALI